ncbi:hypothetical protein [Streptomyces sp. UNOC14_S4]|uniref:hypothetical protein n=1 Tax=Streptomyces sp. UNOC14_S4 TaxID=2872340 RepID=UPI001E2D0941|nr:hypothetical protein [Streptomyces sp. UNOC14_S4]MCC3769442.1 hypothetical protein [Streptomyces sp. UNOC14_S4]
MMSGHTHLTPDLPPIVEVPDLPGAQRPRGGESGATEDGADGVDGVPPAAHGGGAHHGDRDGRHERAGEDSGG